MGDSCEPRIYVACLASYNAGRLHGKWIEASQTADEIREEIDEILRSSPEFIAEDWAIHDYEGFEGIRISEHENIELIAEFAALVEEQRELIGRLVDHCGGLNEIEEAKRMLEEDYAGEADSLEDWAENFLDDTGVLGEVPSSLRYYIDFKSYGRDAELSGDIFTIEIDSKVHVFWNH